MSGEKFRTRNMGHFLVVALLSPRIKQLKTGMLDPKVRLFDPESEVIILLTGNNSPSDSITSQNTRILSKIFTYI
jgi:hypothetical protein